MHACFTREPIFNTRGRKIGEIRSGRDQSGWLWWDVNGAGGMVPPGTDPAVFLNLVAMARLARIDAAAREDSCRVRADRPPLTFAP